MAPVPDVIGLPLDEASARLRVAGIDVQDVAETRPPALGAEPRRTRKPGAGLRVLELTGDLRVLRLQGEGPVHLVVTRERYVAQPPST